MPFFTTSHGERLHYERYGEQGPPLLCLHGLASSGEIWQYQLPLLQRHFRVFCLDYPGHGQSPAVAHYSFERLTRIVAEWVEHLHLPNAHFMGLSISCHVLLAYAAQHPEKVRSLILVGPSGGRTRWPNPLSWPKYMAISLYLFVLALSHLILGQSATAQWVNRTGIQNYGHYPLVERLNQETDPLAIAQLTMENACPPSVDMMEKVQAPILLLRGRGDLFPRRYSAFIQRHVSASLSWVEIPGARHVVCVEQPSRFNPVVWRFLARQSREKSANQGLAAGSATIVPFPKVRTGP
jgi:pimeloyl-ACP methyl ester carboxylesterase